MRKALNAPRMSVSNDESAVLWKAFVNGMVSGTIDPYGVLQLPQEQFDPTLLAEVLNREQETGKERVTGSYDQAIADFLKQADRQQLNAQSRQDLFDRLGKLIERLSPELIDQLNALRKQFPGDINGYYIPRLVYFMGRPIKYGGMFPIWHLRLLRHGKGRCEERQYDQHFYVDGATSGRIARSSR